MTLKQIWKKAKKCSFYVALFAFCFIGGRTTAWLRADMPVTATPTSAKLAIIIDDFGYGGEGTAEMLGLDIPFTAAVMPFSSQSAEDAQNAVNAGKEVIIHMPMESLTGKKEWVGDKGIFCNMDKTSIQACIQEAYTIIPQAVGVNNHMGSAVMENGEVLAMVLDTIKQNDGIFIDSVTTANSKCAALAEQKGITYFKRDVFLDSTDSVAQVEKQLRQAAEIAKKNGRAIAIGHVGPEGGMVTVQALQNLKDPLQKEGICFVKVSELVESH